MCHLKPTGIKIQRDIVHGCTMGSCTRVHYAILARLDNLCLLKPTAYKYNGILYTGAQ